ncbi:hypothetical protein IUS38_24740 [Mycobacteroides abscessus subsp. abscessus]|uniref:hypothetical protein n=1 Tax=Mycobacteroides abscessus TaxID=36809 RepID=UPI0019D162FE|nr:hypothetical protein [Mycobacteroides abscessus]MBN7438793.1 hypothetical protein [Mycobacteroides abscessus subsp. abscessus]
MSRLGRPHLGDRRVVTARLATPVEAFLQDLADQHGLDRSTVIADLAAAAAGRPDLARGLRFEAKLVGPRDDGRLPLAM